MPRDPSAGQPEGSGTPDFGRVEHVCHGGRNPKKFMNRDFANISFT